MPTIPTNLREFADRYTAAWCSQNPARVAEFFSPDGSLTINGGNPSVGREAIARAAASFMTAFPDLRVILDHLIAENEAAEYHWILTGTNSGPEGTGNAVHITGLERQFDKDGLIARSLGYFDTSDYERQLVSGTRDAVGQ